MAINCGCGPECLPYSIHSDLVDPGYSWTPGPQPTSSWGPLSSLPGPSPLPLRTPTPPATVGPRQDWSKKIRFCPFQGTRRAAAIKPLAIGNTEPHCHIQSATRQHQTHFHAPACLPCSHDLCKNSSRCPGRRLCHRERFGEMPRPDVAVRRVLRPWPKSRKTNRHTHE